MDTIMLNEFIEAMPLYLKAIYIFFIICMLFIIVKFIDKVF